MNSELKILLTGLLLGAGCMYGYVWRSNVLASAYMQGRVDVMSLVCPPVVNAVAEAQQKAQGQQPKEPKTPK